MKTSRFLFYAFAAAALAACAKEMDSPVAPVEEPLAREDATFVLTASTSEMTRTELSSDNKVLWKSGDAISVWESGNASNANVRLTLDSSCAGAAAGDFTGTLTPAGENFTLYAVYPYQSAYGTDPAEVALSIPTAVSQCETVNGLVGVSDFMIGQASLSASAAKYEMCFKHPLALLDILIDGSTSVLSYAKIESLTITANTAFVGGVKADLTSGTLTSTAGDEGKTLTITFPADATLSTARHAWVAINPVDLTEGEVCWDLKMTNGQELKFNVNPKVAFEAQKIYHINLTDFDTRVEDYKCTPVYVDLIGKSGGVRANCYIVSEPGYYRFAAQRVDKSNCFDGTKPQTNGYKADWLWSTGTTSKLGFVGLGDSGNINFRVNAGEDANAVIALYNPSKEIVWSWHIWCTSEDPLTPTHYGRNNAWLMIDRNLGALSNQQGNVKSYGLMYQWGRKDPFPGPATVGSLATSKETTAFQTNTESYVFNPNATIQAFSSARNSNTASVGDIAYTIAHPTTNLHFYAKTGATALGNTWLYTTPQADAMKLWNSTGERKATSKTNYDPCPPGYMVPISNSYAWYTTWTNNIDFETNENLSGIVLYENDANTTYYPAVGYRSSGQLANVGYGAYYPAANAIADGGNLVVYGLQCYNRTSKSNGAKLNTQFALPVRCMKI